MGKVLIIEDDSLIIKVYSTRLKSSGHNVFTAGDGEAGLELARKIIPDVVLLDLMLPKLSGLEVLAELKKDPKTSKFPVIVYSNLGRDKEIQKAKNLGAAEFITKADYMSSSGAYTSVDYLK